MNNNRFDEAKFKEDLNKYSSLFFSSKLAANQILNMVMLTTFYEIGQDIQSKGRWFEMYIKRVSESFPEHKLLMSPQNIRSMCKFSSLVKVEEIVSLRLFEFSWDRLLHCIEISNSHDEFVAYVKEERKIGVA